jgi:hypothetical protein
VDERIAHEADLLVARDCGLTAQTSRVILKFQPKREELKILRVRLDCRELV